MALPGLASQAAEERHQVVSAVFLDRDGVINANLERNGKPVAPTNLSEFRILPGVAEAARLLKEAGFLLIVVTNQPDVANGLTLRAMVDAMHAEIMRLLPIETLKRHSDYERVVPLQRHDVPPMGVQQAGGIERDELPD